MFNNSAEKTRVAFAALNECAVEWPADLLPPDIVVAVAEHRHRDAILHPLESAHISRCAMLPPRESEFRLGRAMAREALARFGIHGHALLPSSTREPDWPLGIVGSISHCGRHGDNLCIVAVAEKTRWAGIGIDVENVRRIDERIVATVCTPIEQRRLSSVAAEQRQGLLSLIFSAKESVFKAIFPATRRFIDFADVTIDVDFDDRHFTARPAEASIPADLLAAVQGRFHLGAELVMTTALLPSP